MIYSKAHDKYVPIFYILLQSKLEMVYFQALHFVKTHSPDSFNPKTITCDFEQGLLKAIEDQFKEVPIVACLFHWKQALVRKLESFHVKKGFNTFVCSKKN
jgi:hypothetical protein